MARDYAASGPLGPLYISETGTRDVAVLSAYIMETSGGAAFSLSCAGAAFTLSGQAAGLKRTSRLATASGLYILTGGATGPGSLRKLDAGVGTYAVTIASAQPVLQAQLGSFGVAGQAVDFAYMPVTTKLVAAGATFDLVGGEADFLWTRPFSASAGSFGITGGAASFHLGNRSLTAEAGAFAITGIPTGNRLAAHRGGFIAEGQDVALTLNADTLWTRISDVGEVWTRVSN